MTPLSRYRRHLRIEVLLAVTAYAVALQNFELLFILGAAALASGYVSDGPRGRYLPIWATTILAAIFFGWSILSFLGNPDPASAMALVGRLGCCLAVLRLFGRRSAREDRQVILLSVVAVVGACLYSFQFLFGLVVVVFSLHTVQVIMLNRLQSGLDDARAERRDLIADLPVPPVEAASGRSPIGQFRGLVVGCTVVACVLATGVFLIFPRKIDAGGAALGSRTGFTAEVDLTRNDQIEQSNREVFTVEWADPQGVPIQWPQPLRLRGAVLDRWSSADRRWMSSVGRRYLRTVTTSGDPDVFVSLGAAEISRGLYTQTVTMRSLATSRVFARWAPLAIACDQPRTFTIEPADLELEDTVTGELDRFTTYRLLIDPNPSPEAIESIAGDAIPPVRPPVFNVPGVREEAERILREEAPALLEPLIATGNGADADEANRWRRNRQMAEIFTKYLRGEDFRYTLDLRRFVQRRGVDPILAFLTEYRFGHCEYFASGLAGLCQSMGIECRVITGFVAVEYDDAIGRYIVRESNAHAWVEVRTGRWSWREFDPTSSEVLDELQAGRRSWADDWRWLYDRADFLWTSRFVTFDGTTQATLADRFGEFVGSGGWGILEDAKAISRKVNRYFQLGPAGYIWLGTVALAMGLAVIAIVAQLRRRRRIRQVLHAGKDLPNGRIREAAFYLDVLDAFAAAGCAKPESTPPMKHLDAVLRVRPDVAEAARPLVEIFYEVRFGSRRLDASARRSVSDSVAQLRTMAKGGLQ
jgi:transglutaminase-like putative cysteine protease